MRRASAMASRRGSLAGRLDAFKAKTASNKAKMIDLAHKEGHKAVDKKKEKLKEEAKALGPPKDHREALTRFYGRVAPDKLAFVGQILKRFEGNSEKMYTLLGSMFPGELIERPST